MKFFYFMYPKFSPKNWLAKNVVFKKMSQKIYKRRYFMLSSLYMSKYFLSSFSLESPVREC